MCGRLACGLQRQDVCNSCCSKEPASNQYVAAQWRDCYNLGKTYNPSYNICPSEVAPVLLSGTHFQLPSRVVLPMIFGVIPNWAKANISKYSTINCRIETIQSSKLFGNLLEKNQRCVVICNGFFEWQKQSGSKKPYFIHSEQPNQIKVDDPDTWDLSFTPERGFSGFRPLKLAALFETDYSESLEEATFSFTIITKEAGSEMSWLHDRMPVVLETEEKLDAWLNHKEVSAKLALSLLSHKSKFICMPVSNSVSKTANKDISCIKQTEESNENNKNKRSSAGFLKNWLEKGQKRKSSEVLEDKSDEVKKKALT